MILHNKYFKVLGFSIMTVFMAVTVLFATVIVAHAQSFYTGSDGRSYSVPTGYNFYANNVYYSPSLSMYYDALTGQYSTTAPVGPTITGGLYNVPAGYSSSVYGTYYNPSNQMYFDPVTGFYSTGAPVGPTFYTFPNVPVNPVINPGVPNTGAGGDAAGILILLAFATMCALGGIALVTKATRSF